MADHIWMQKPLTWTLALMAIVVLYVGVADTFYAKDKVPANQLLSPWDVSKAPPTSIKPGRIKVKPLLYKPALAFQSKQTHRRSINKRHSHKQIHPTQLAAR